jgi:hypothetical protein
VLTSGGTGITPTDRTPEATREVIDYEVPGIAEAIRGRSLAGVPTAALSRGLAGVAGRTLIVNLPGSTGGARDGLAVLGPILRTRSPAAWRRLIRALATRLRSGVRLTDMGAMAWTRRGRWYAAGRDAAAAPVEVPLADADRHTLAELLVARTDLPAFPTSSVDGWAVRGPGPWRVVGRVLVRFRRARAHRGRHDHGDRDGRDGAVRYRGDRVDSHRDGDGLVSGNPVPFGSGASPVRRPAAARLLLTVPRSRPAWSGWRARAATTSWWSGYPALPC